MSEFDAYAADYDAASDVHDDVKVQAHASVDALYALMAAGLRPRDIMTTQAFENAIVTAYAMGGSTNMYLHLLAVAREAGVPLTIERIQAVHRGDDLKILRRQLRFQKPDVGNDVIDYENAGRHDFFLRNPSMVWRKLTTEMGFEM